MTRYVIDPTSSTVLVAARSSMGPIVFEARENRGHIDAEVVDGQVLADPGPAAELHVGLATLRSGNDLYDAELRRRIDARRFPECHLSLRDASSITGTRFAVRGDMSFHGVERSTSGTVEVEAASDERLVITGAKQFDIRDFDIPAPGILMVKIYPEVEVQVFLDARADPSDPLPDKDGQ